MVYDETYNKECLSVKETPQMNPMKHHVVPFGAMRYCVLVTYGACAFE